MGWKVEEYKIEDISFWRVLYNGKLTFMINRCPKKSFDIALYGPDASITKIYNHSVIKSHKIVLDFVNKHNIYDETLMYILFNIF